MPSSVGGEQRHPSRRQVIRNVIRSGELRKAIERRSRAAAPLEVVQFLRPQLQDGIIAPVPELFPTSLPLGIVAEECIPNRFRVTRLDDNSWAQLIGVRPEDVVIFADGDAVYAKRHEDLAPQVMRKRPVTRCVVSWRHGRLETAQIPLRGGIGMLDNF